MYGFREETMIRCCSCFPPGLLKVGMMVLRGYFTLHHGSEDRAAQTAVKLMFCTLIPLLFAHGTLAEGQSIVSPTESTAQEFQYLLILVS